MNKIILLHVFALLLAQQAEAKAMAFMCAWDTGDMIFAKIVGEKDTEVSQSDTEDGETYTVKVTDLKSRVSRGTLTITGKGRLRSQTVKCIMVEE